MIKDKIEIMSIIDDFRRLADTSEFRCKGNLLNNFKKTLKTYVKFVNDDFRNDIEYLEDCIDILKNLFDSYAKKISLRGLKQLDICLMTIMRIMTYVQLKINNTVIF